MKKFILAAGLCLPFAAFAQMVFPQVTNWGSRAELQVYNTTANPVWCSGSIFLSLDSGSTQNEFVSAYVMAGSFYTQSYYVRDFNDRIRSASNSVYCR
jgi:hypothetical protein